MSPPCMKGIFMLKYLDYIRLELPKLITQKDILDFLINEITLYKNYWKKFSNDNSRSPLYKSVPTLYNTHNINLPTNETVSISWDIDQLYNIVKQAPIHQVPLSTFEELLYDDLTASVDEFSRISQKVDSIYPHKYAPLLVICFKPTQNALLFDDRHRYIEHKKFKSSKLIPFYYLDDEMCFTSILLKKELLTYIILHNIEIINNYITGRGTLERLIDIKNCMG